MTRQIITAIKTATRFKHAPLNTYVSFSHTPAGQDLEGYPAGDEEGGGSGWVEVEEAMWGGAAEGLGDRGVEGGGFRAEPAWGPVGPAGGQVAHDHQPDPAGGRQGVADGCGGRGAEGGRDSDGGEACRRWFEGGQEVGGDGEGQR